MSTGYEDLDLGELTPRYWLVQPTSKEGTPGTVRDELGNSWKELSITPLVVKPGRVMWQEGNPEPLCKSRDGATPDQTIATPQSASCAQCGNSKWLDDAKPLCRETLQLTAINHSSDDAKFNITLQGVNIKPVKLMVAYYLQRGLPLAAAKCTMSIKKAKNAKGNFYVAAFENFERHSDEVSKKYSSTTAADDVPF